ncbi:putative lethal(3)malignant brain tumor-like protein 3 isoform X1 [Penaeus vannamei]|uniref:Putative lethal(3)malignant brain tumor-like protein 3 isoform X1 n=1 Tax=Penaeus vannamei TaxID=6689 RepID=A0A423SM15_PENVA|nr:putative lethal(3)malignant brain tumor-like protein 3 isoform X1 [Penaeus vannamei]
MADQQTAEKPAPKPENKSKEPQKFVYLQLQQDRTGDGGGRVAALVPGRGPSGPAHFIPLTAKLNSISVLGSGSRPSRTTVPPPRNPTGAVVSVGSPRSVVATTVTVAATRCMATSAVTVSSSRPVTTVAARPGAAATVVRKTHTNVVVSSGISRPVVPQSATTITVLGSGGPLPNTPATVLRPSASQGSQSHGPVILHTSKVSPPVSSSSTSGGGKVVSPRLVPIPITQVRSGVANKAVLSYSAILQPGGSSGGGGVVGSSVMAKKEGHTPSQPLLLQAAPPTTVKGAALAKTAGATISIITGKGTKQPGTVPGPTPNPVNMLSVNLGQNKPNMINFKISNGQIQADSMQQVDVLREARPMVQGGGKQMDERKDNPIVMAVPLSNQVSIPTSLPMTVTVARSVPEPPISSTVDDDSSIDTRDLMCTNKGEREDILQKAVSQLGVALEESRQRGPEDFPPYLDTYDHEQQLKPDTEFVEPEKEKEANEEVVRVKEEPMNIDSESQVLDVRKEILRTMLNKSQNSSRSSSPSHEVQVEPLDRVKEEKSPSREAENCTDHKADNSPAGKPKQQEAEEDIKPEKVKFIELLKWEDGVGKLDGTDLKFKINEFDAVEIIEDRDLEDIKNNHCKKVEPLTPRHHARKPNFRDLIKDEEIFSDNSQDSESQGNKSTRESDDICCCKNCGCYGLSSEFFRDSNFCSEHDARELEWGKERLKQEKERQRRKKLRQCEKGEGDEQGAGCEGREGNRSEAEESGQVSDEESRQARNLMGTESLVSRFQHPWQDGKNNFSWVKYLEHCGRAKGMAKAAPLKLWPEPFPFGRNLFKAGMKLEAIDPQHQSLFCVMTVAETIGYRVRLHFDGYSDQYDFWVNADSPNIFPAGWCEKNGRQLEPPLGVLGFSWKAYLEHCKAQTAPRQAFANKGNSTVIPPNNFRVGMKLEAEDRKNMWVCVATVADVLDNRVLIHFDGWDKAFDFWSEVSSPYIHPVGWCADNNIVLHPPNNYPNPESFNWHEYIQETNSMAVPARAFKTRPPREFKKNMKLEVVDKRNPSLIRVATIVDVQDYQIKIHFDGWGDAYDYWLDDDSPDIHPPSWSNKTGHPLQPPLTPEQQAEDVDSGMGCGTAGCKGIGHVKGPIYTTHHTAYGCPYSTQNLNKDLDTLIPDRLQPAQEKKKGKIAPKVKLDLRPFSGNKDAFADETPCQKKRVRKRRKFFDELSPPEPTRPQKVPKANEEVRAASNSNILPSAISSCTVTIATATAPITVTTVTSNATTPTSSNQSVFNPGYNPHPAAPIPHSWERHRHLTASLGDAKRADVEAWDASQVQQLVARIPGCEQVSSVFVEQQIDGEALLMMTQNDLVNLLHIKLGPAIKIMAVIMCLRSST